MKINPELIVDALTDMGSFADSFFNPEKDLCNLFGRSVCHSNGDYRTFSTMLTRPPGRKGPRYLYVIFTERTKQYRREVHGPKDFVRFDVYENYNRTRRREVTVSPDLSKARIYGEIVDFVESLKSNWPETEKEALDRFEELANYVKDKSVS